MKYSIVTSIASALAALLPLVTAVPTNSVINARDGAGCPFGSNFFTVVTQKNDDSGKVRFNLLQDSVVDKAPNAPVNGDIPPNVLVLLDSDQPNPQSSFEFLPLDSVFLPQDSGNTTFFLRSVGSGMQLIIDTSDNITSNQTGTGFDFFCSQCLGDLSGSKAGKLFAKDCTIQANNLCVTDLNGVSARLSMTECGSDGQLFSMFGSSGPDGG